MDVKFNIKDYSGQRHGMLIVVGSTGERQYFPSGKSKKLWLLRCDCGQEIIRSSQSICNWSSLPDDKKIKISCGCQKKHGSYSVAFEIYKSEYADGDISFDQFCNLSQKDCYHCGSKVHKSGSLKKKFAIKMVNGRRTKTDTISATYQYHGLDRIDNNGKHTLDNVVTCCAPCNYLRGGRSLSDFLYRVKNIYLSHKKRGYYDSEG